MDYKKRIIKHFYNLQKYIRNAEKTDSFPTVKQMTRILNDIQKGKQLIRQLPVYKSRSSALRLVTLDALFRIRVRDSIFVAAAPDTVKRWCERNGLEVSIVQLNVSTVHKRRAIPKRLLMVTLVGREEDEYELSEHIGVGEGEQGET